jgi:hypothetical protein
LQILNFNKFFLPISLFIFVMFGDLYVIMVGDLYSKV